MSRDYQRSAVYRAEDRVPWGQPLPELADVQAFVDRVVGGPHWTRGAPHVPRVVVARDGRGRRHACSEESWFGGEIKLPKWSRSELIVLHELAHARVPKGAAADDLSLSPHGPRFTAEYLALVRRYLSPEIADELAQSFADEGVDVGELPAAAEASSTDPRKILRLVQELRALSEGTDSPHEAAAAAAKAQKLLLQHNLTVGDLEHAHADADPLVERKREFGGGRRRIESWRNMLVQAVASSCLCEWMTSWYREPGPRTFSFIGRASNVEVALYSYECLERQVRELVDREKRRRQRNKQTVRGYLATYCEGIVQTIQENLSAGRVDFEAEPSSMALMTSRQREAFSHRSQLYPGVRFQSSTWTAANPSAFYAGREAGKEVRLDHALRSDGSVQRFIERTGDS